MAPLTRARQRVVSSETPAVNPISRSVDYFQFGIRVLTNCFLRHRFSSNLLNGMVVVSQEEWARTEVAMVPIERLLTGLSPRRRGISSGHVEQLVESGGDWPPILVQRSTMTHGPDSLSSDHRDWEFPWIDLGGEG